MAGIADVPLGLETRHQTDKAEIPRYPLPLQGLLLTIGTEMVGVATALLAMWVTRAADAGTGGVNSIGHPNVTEKPVVPTRVRGISVSPVPTEAGGIRSSEPRVVNRAEPDGAARYRELLELPPF